MMAFIVFITCSIFTIQLHVNEKKLVISWGWEPQPDSPISKKQEPPAPQYPPPNSPEQGVDEGPKLTPRLSPRLDPNSDLGRRNLMVNDPPELLQEPKLVDILVSLYSDPSFKGTPLDLNLKWAACFNLPVAFDDVTSSVSTYGGCMRLCEDRGCRGRCEEMNDGSLGSASFGIINFNDKVSSIGTCKVTDVGI